MYFVVGYKSAVSISKVDAPAFDTYSAHILNNTFDKYGPILSMTYFEKKAEAVRFAAELVENLQEEVVSSE